MTEPRAGASGVVLLTLCAGQFLMMLDTSVMNVSMATVAQGRRHDDHGYPDGDHALHARDGGADGHGRQDRADARAQARVRDRLRDLRRGLGADRALAEPRGAARRVVVPGGHRRLPDPAGDRRPRRARTSGRGERPRAYGLVASAAAIAVAVGPIVGGAFTTYLSWRYVFAGEVVIVVGDPVARAADRRRNRPGRAGARSTGSELPSRRSGLGADRLRHPARGHVGLRQAEARSARVDRPVAHDLAAARGRASCCWLFMSWESHADRAGQGTADRPGDPARSAAP